MMTVGKKFSPWFPSSGLQNTVNYVKGQAKQTVYHFLLISCKEPFKTERQRNGAWLKNTGVLLYFGSKFHQRGFVLLLEKLFHAMETLPCSTKVQFCRGVRLLLTSSSTIRGFIIKFPLRNPPNFPSAESLLPSRRDNGLFRPPMLRAAPWIQCSRWTGCQASSSSCRPCIVPNCFSRVKRRAVLERRDAAGPEDGRRGVPGSFLAQMCAVALSQAHICSRLNLLGEFLHRCVPPYILPCWILNWGGEMSWSTASLCSSSHISLCVSHTASPWQSDKQAQLVADGVGSFVLGKL